MAGYRWTKLADKGLPVCLPDGYNLNDIIAMSRLFLKQHPETRKMAPADVFYGVLAVNFPCK